MTTRRGGGSLAYDQLYEELILTDTVNEKVRQHINRQASLAVCDQAVDVDEARTFLEMLGLIEPPGDARPADLDVDVDVEPSKQLVPEHCNNCDRKMLIATTGKGKGKGNGPPAPPFRVFHRARGLCNRCYRFMHRHGRINEWAPIGRGTPHTEEFMQRRRDYIDKILELEHLNPGRAAAVLGVTPGTVARRLRRYGRVDLGRRFDSEATKQRRLRLRAEGRRW